MACHVHKAPLALEIINTRSLRPLLRRRLRSKVLNLLQTRTFVNNSSACPDFGLLFDIDGVVVRGRQILPGARDAFRYLTDRNGQFWVPTIFVTNAGNARRSAKAKQLSEWLDVEVAPEQVVMAHSPLRRFQQFLDKHVLVSGQGPTQEIAQQLGFQHVTTVDTLRNCFPRLDMVDHKRRKSAPCAFEKYFPKIEAVLLFGEPVRWETSLQLIVDVLLTNGRPSESPEEIVYPHLPVLACNMDLLFMAEACMPRFAHGCFLHCLEALYKKISGYELKYTALIGKPSEITYHYSEQVLQERGGHMGSQGLRRMYCIGDNPDVDIYGANLFNRYLQRRRDSKLEALRLAQGGVAQGEVTEVTDYVGMERCESVLVCTGVFHPDLPKPAALLSRRNHSHRDFLYDPILCTPHIFVSDVLSAVKAIFEKEAIS